MRVFCFADGNYEEKFCGGGKGVTYRLLAANRKYHIIDDAFFVFNDAVKRADDDLFLIRKDDSLKAGIEGLIGFYEYLRKKLDFSSEDVFVFHDFSCFYALKNVVPYIDKTAIVYHGQGSLFHEAVAFKFNPSEDYRAKCNILTEFSLSKSQKVCFPSKGAKEAFVLTSDESINRILNNCDCQILYNGCSPVLSKEPTEIDELLDTIALEKKAKKIFVTVATLNEAKGVDRLPAFFADYGKTNDYLWIVVGDGGKRDELASGIEEIKENVIWIQKPVSNGAIIKLYALSDYYILAHRLSIFDFSTIEAMHMGVVPVLTAVGGNLEMIVDNNGFFLDENIGSSSNFSKWEKEIDINILKKKNQLIAEEHFSEYSMLKGYSNLVNELRGEEGEKDYLFIVPDLELNGAQVVLNELLSMGIFGGKKIDLISPTKGAYGRIYKDKGINVIIRPCVAGDESFRNHLQSDYKRVFINTSSCSMYLMYYFNTKVPVYFWLHETLAQLSREGNMLDPRMYSSNIHVLGVTNEVKQGLQKKYGNIRVELLPMPIADMIDSDLPDIERIPEDLLSSLDGKVLFFLPAAYTIIKGQDILLEAISQLPKEYLDRAHFIMCGYKLTGQEAYYETLRRISANISEMTMFDELSREDVYFWYRVSDCVLAPSRVDATPTSIVEAMMFGKTVLVSDATGISKYLKDCVNAFVFPSENVEEFKKRIMLIIADYDKLDYIGINARRIYEESFSPNHVKNLLEEYFELSKHKKLEERVAEYDCKLDVDGESDWGEPVGREIW